MSESESCENLHADLASLLAKEEQSIKRNSCNEESEKDKAEENFFDTMLSDLTKAKQKFSQLFISAQASPLLISGMNLLTPDRPIDSPRYLSFQGVGENPIKLIYPNLFKIEVYKDGAVAELKNTKELRLAIEKYFKNKVEEYNLILEQEKKQAKPLTPHYEKLTLIDKLATPLLDIRPYEPFTYKEFLEAVGGQKMINTLAELLYYQSISNQLRTIYDEIDKDLDELRKTFDINEKIGYIVGEYLGQDKRPFYE